MQTLVQTGSISWAQTVRIALLGEGLHATVRDEWSLTGPRSGSPVQIIEVPEGEYAKARAILGGLAPPQDQAVSPGQKRGLLVAGLGFLLGFYVLVRFTDFDSKPLAYVALGGAIVCVTLGVLLAARATRSNDKPLRQDKGVNSSDDR